MIIDRYVSSTGSNTYAASVSAGTPMSLATALSNAASGDRINIIADGVYNRGTTIDTFALKTSASSPLIWRGYLTTPGDGYQGRVNGNGPLITTNMPIINYNGAGKINVSSGHQVFDSLFISGSGPAATVSLTQLLIADDADNVIQNSVVMSSNTTQGAGGITQTATVYNCDVICTNPGLGQLYGIFANAINYRVINTRITMPLGTGSYGISNSNGYTTVIGNVIIGGGGQGLGLRANGVTGIFYGNTVVGFQDGINISGDAGSLVINNLLTDNSGYGININSTGFSLFMAYNSFRNNGSGNVYASPDWVTGAVYGNISGGNSTVGIDYVGYPTDLRLASTSLAVGMGNFSPASIGALQYTPGTGAAAGGETSSFFV